MRTRGLIRSSESEDGAVAVTVGITLFVLVGFSALAIDLGSAWQTKRDLVTDTDAGALAAARHLVNLSGPAFLAECTALQNDATESSTGAYGDATETLDANKVDSTQAISDFDGSNCDSSSQSGHVLVGAKQDAQLTFAGVLGVDQIRPESLAVAQYGDVVSLGGLRPFGLCFDPNDPTTTDGHVRQWVEAVDRSGDPHHDAIYNALPLVKDPNGDGEIDYPWNSDLGGSTHARSSAYPSTPPGPNGPVVYRVHYRIPSMGGPPGSGGSVGCGVGAGNTYYGVFCFVDRNCNNRGLGQLLDRGYDGVVSVDPPVQCQPDGTSTCEGKTGVDLFAASHSGTWQKLIDNETVIVLPLYSEATGGAGTNLVYEPSGFVGAVIRGVRLAGNNAVNPSYVDLEFFTVSLSGRIGSAPGGVSTGVRGIQLCSNDADPLDIGDRCDVG